MGITYYLLAGCNTSPHRVERQAWERKNLTDIPELLRYDAVQIGSITSYTNVAGAEALLTLYGTFTTEKEMFADYNNLGPIYTQQYSLLTAHNADIDWVIPVCASQSAMCIEASIVTLSDSILADNTQYVSLIDASIIYQSCKKISKFFMRLPIGTFLNRSQQALVSYYVQALHCISAPDFFLTNQLEIKYCSEFFAKWSIPSAITVTQDLCSHVLSLMSSISSHKNHDIKFMGQVSVTFVSYFIGYEAIRDVLLYFWPQYSYIIDVWMHRFMLVAAIAFAIFLICSLVHIVYDVCIQRNNIPR